MRKKTLITTVILLLAVSVFIIQLAYKHKEGKVRYNLILITVDALRPDYLSCYGLKAILCQILTDLLREGHYLPRRLAKDPGRDLQCVRS